MGIQHVTVIDVENNRRLRDQTVVIEGTRIATVGPSSQVRIPDGYGVVEGRGKFVIPGFVDARLFVRDSTGAISGDAARRRLERDVLMGVTTVVLAPDDSVLTRRGGDVLLPRVHVVRDGEGGYAPATAPIPQRPNDLSIVDYLRRLVQMGESPVGALRVATFETARVIKWHDRVGSVAPNRLADLLILSANPLDDVGNVALIDAMVIDGRFVDGAERSARLARLPSR
jgi:adenine deaminase